MKTLSIVCALLFALSANTAFARDTKVMLNIEEIMQTADYQDKLDPEIKFYFGDQPYGEIQRSYGTYVTNKKTNAFNKGDHEACRWVTLTALLTLQERAKREGGNAIVDITSYYKKRTLKSDIDIECHAGTFIAGTALRGKIVKL